MSLKSSVMEFLKIDELKENLLKLLEAKFELKKLEIIDQAKPKIAGLVFTLILFVLGLVTYMLFIGGLAYYIGAHLLDSPALGFLALGVLHGLILAIFYLNAGNIKTKIEKGIGQKIDKLS